MADRVPNNADTHDSLEFWLRRNGDFTKNLNRRQDREPSSHTSTIESQYIRYQGLEAALGRGH